MSIVSVRWPLTCVIGGIMEHIEQAGVHSGDSACSLPPYSLPESLQDELRRQTALMARALKVVGLMNVQFAIQGEGDDRTVYVLEVNPRASRTVPFVSKATGQRWPRSPHVAWPARSWSTSVARMAWHRAR